MKENASSDPERRSVHVNGMELHYEARGEGRPLVLLHGFTGCAADWRYIFPEAPSGYQLLAPDLRGHGSSWNPEPAFSFRQCAADVTVWLDQLGVTRAHAIGLSGGGQTLMHVATASPERIRAQVLVSTAPYFPREARALMEAVRPEAMREEDWKAMRARHTHGDEQIRALWEQGRAFKDSYEDVNFTPPLLGRITARTLIAHGDRDPFYPVAMATEMFDAIPSASLWIMPDAGHAPVFGSRADEFRRIALRFLRKGIGADFTPSKEEGDPLSRTSS